MSATPLPLMVVRREVALPTHALIECEFARITEWATDYLSFSGFFGSFGPNLFAAAPDLLEALQMALKELDALNIDAIGFDRTVLTTMRESVAKAVQP